jgi:hypothetical protein
MDRLPARDRVATVDRALFLLDAIDVGAAIILPRIPAAGFDHLLAGIIRDATVALRALGMDGDAALDLMLQHTVTVPDAAGQLRRSAVEVVSRIERGELGGLRVGSEWLVSRRGLERLVMMLAEAEKWFGGSGTDGAREP